MRIQPRQQLLALWSATVRSAFRDGRWHWDGAAQRNSIQDAEQLLCLLLPATEMSALRLEVPDDTTSDVLAALRPLGDAVEIPRQLANLLNEYMDMYTDSSGAPVFPAGSYVWSAEEGVEVTDEQRNIEVVDAYAVSVRLSLAALGFLRVFAFSTTRKNTRERLAQAEAAASLRLTAALKGLVRSFTVSAFRPDGPEGRVLLSALNQTGEPERRVLEELVDRLQSVRGRFSESGLATGDDLDLGNPNMLFECGWTWGIAEDAPTVVFDNASVERQQPGVAVSAPYLLSTVVALRAISSLLSDRTRVLDLLNAEQQRLAQALQVRADLTRLYFSRIARFGKGRWPLEDIPWRTYDGQQSEYFSLLIAGLVVEDMVLRRGADEQLTRVVAVLEELAVRGRITRRALPGDSQILLHVPGLGIRLEGSEKLGPQLGLYGADFATQLLDWTLVAAAATSDIRVRDRLVRLADEAFDHLAARRVRDGRSRGLWDAPAAAFGLAEEPFDAGPSWYLTERVAAALVSAAYLAAQRPLRSQSLIEITTDLLSEAEHELSRQTLETPASLGSALERALQDIKFNLEHARELLYDRPGGAHALAVEALRQMETYARARADVLRGI